MKHRHLAENLLKINEIIQHCEDSQTNGLLISFDFFKAFDTVAWSSLFSAMEKFNFGPKFIAMSKIIFKDPLTYVMNNGYWSEAIKPTRGCRQGCCYSPGAFNIVVEMLAIALRQNEDVKGIQIGDEIIKSGQFADDLWTSLQADPNSLNATLNELERFRDFSGLNINYEKTTVMKLGPFRHTDAKYYTMKKLYLSPGPIKILGVFVTPNENEIFKSNHWKVLKKAENILMDWSNRQLTIIGKITVANALISTLFIHLFMALPTPPPEFFRAYQVMIMKYLWGDTPPRISYKKLVQNYTKLGLKLIDLETKDIAIKAAWPCRWKERKETEIKWVYTLLPVKDKRLWLCNTSSEDIEKHFTNNNRCSPKISVIPCIWRAWAKHNYSPTLSDPEDILDSIIWGNSLIR